MARPNKYKTKMKVIPIIFYHPTKTEIGLSSDEMREMILKYFNFDDSELEVSLEEKVEKYE
jgi:hypothetical protein